MNLVDNFKLRGVIEETIKFLGFLDSVKAQDDISSELAGFEISKLLKEQEDNERTFAELQKRRAQLNSITDKEELQEVDARIVSLSMILKESTKKLCKLFKENPDLEGDSAKVTRERKALMVKLEELSEHVKNGSSSKFQSFVSHELESQDQLRKLLEKEKQLNMDIKRLQQERSAETREFQKEKAENQARIQEIKEELLLIQQQAELEVNYFRKETKAELSNQQRIFAQAEKALNVEIEHLRSAIRTELLVHRELEDFLGRTVGTLRQKAPELTTRTEECREQLEATIKAINDQIKQSAVELEAFKLRYQQEEARKLEREKAERDKQFERQQRDQLKLRLHNAVKYIQHEYQAWKEAGGGKKKKKK